MDALSSLSEGLAGIIGAAGPSVVRVDTRRRGRGTGVAWSSDGLFVTADHVVQSEEGIQVTLANGTSAPATLVGRDPSTDVAVLRADGAGATAVDWAGTDALRVGHLVVALARPGRTLRATVGIVSALGEEWRTPGGGRLDRYIESDAVMYPGFSGGPLLDTGGKVLGINTAGLRRGGGLTVPASTVGRVVEALVAHGRIRRGYLGIAAQPVRLPSKVQSQFGQDRGLLVLEVDPGSPADAGGLLLGDTVLAVAGQPVRDLGELFGQLGGDRIGTPLPMRVLRSGHDQQLTIVVGERLRKTA